MDTEDSLFVVENSEFYRCVMEFLVEHSYLEKEI